MKTYLKFIYYIILFVIFSNCKGEVSHGNNNTGLSNRTQINDTATTTNDTIINSVMKGYIEKRISKNEEVKILYSKLKISFEREFERPYNWDIFNEKDSIKYYRYKFIDLGAIRFNLYYITVNYEDAKYELLMMINPNIENEFNSLIIYENLESEENFKRYSIINHPILESVFSIEKKQYKTLKFLLKDGLILDYLDGNNKFKKEWGDKDVIYKKDGKDSTQVYEYLLDGEIKDNIKQGKWLEKRYIIDYKKSVLTDGNYTNGLKDGEWSFSPDGPADKVKVFRKGKCINTFYP